MLTFDHHSRVYVTFAMLASFLMLMIWFNKPHELTQFTPAYAFLVCPGLFNPLRNH